MTIGPAPMIRMLFRSVRLGIRFSGQSIHAGGGEFHAEAKKQGASTTGQCGARPAPATKCRGQAGAAENQRAQVKEAEALRDRAENGEGQRLVCIARIDELD